MLHIIKVVSTLQLSPFLLKDLRMALSRGRKKSAMSAGSRITAFGGGLNASLQAHGQAQNQRNGNLRRFDGVHFKAPNTWKWVRASNRKYISHGPRSYYQQTATRAKAVT